MRRPLVVAGVVCGVLLSAACGSSSPSGPLGETTSNLAKLHSGVLDLRLTAAAGEQATGEQAGFRLRGPFAAGAKGQLPVTDMTYTRYLGQRQTAVTVVSTGRQAFVQLNGRSYVLPPSETAKLKSSGTGQGVDLHLDQWFDNPKVSDAGLVDGVAAQRVTGRLKVANALDDLLRVSRKFGASDVSSPKLKGSLGKQLERSVESSSADVISGTRDHQLRRLVVEIKLRSQAPAQVRQALGRLSAVRFHFELDLSGPNRPVHVTAPAHPLPYADLPRA